MNFSSPFSLRVSFGGFGVDFYLLLLFGFSTGDGGGFCCCFCCF